MATSTISIQGSSAQQQWMEKVMQEYKDIFTSLIGVPLHCQVKNSINITLGVLLPNESMYRRSIMENDQIKRNIQELWQKGHIRPRSSPYGSPIASVQKKNDTWRLCIDYCAFNNIIVQNTYPIPRIDDLLGQLKQAKYYNIDIKIGYHQVPIEPSNVWKITFKSKEILFKWIVMPFELMNAPTTFMWLKDNILRPFNCQKILYQGAMEHIKYCRNINTENA